MHILRINQHIIYAFKLKAPNEYFNTEKRLINWNVESKKKMLGKKLHTCNIFYMWGLRKNKKTAIRRKRNVSGTVDLQKGTAKLCKNFLYNSFLLMDFRKTENSKFNSKT